jgi:serine protease inhibitor
MLTLTSIACVAVFIVMGNNSNGAPSPEQQKLVGANNAFAFKLLKEVCREQPGKNIIISPYSAATVLETVSLGANGTTKLEMQQVLGTV